MIYLAGGVEVDKAFVLKAVVLRGAEPARCQDWGHYRDDLHAPTKFLSETVLGPGRSGVLAIWSNRFQRRHHVHPKFFD